jgi:hypothetical protein
MLEKPNVASGNRSEKTITYRVVDSYVRHYIPFVATRNIVTEGHANMMRGVMTKRSLFAYRVEGELVNSHGCASHYVSTWFYIGSPHLGIFISLGKASGYPNRSGYAPYWVVGFSKGLRDWGLMLGKWRFALGVVYVTYWRMPW